jgi:hypothetical protein
MQTPVPKVCSLKNSVRAEDETGSTRMQLDRRSFNTRGKRQEKDGREGDGREGNAREIRKANQLK